MRTPLVVALDSCRRRGTRSPSPSLSRNATTAPPPARTKTVLVDMSAIAQNSTRLKQSMDALRADYVAKGEALKKEGERAIESPRKRASSGRQPGAQGNGAKGALAAGRFRIARQESQRRNTRARDENRVLDAAGTQGRNGAPRSGQRRAAHLATRPDAAGSERRPRDSGGNPKADRLSARHRVTPAILEALNRRAPAAAATSRTGQR